MDDEYMVAHYCDLCVHVEMNNGVMCIWVCACC